MKRTAHIETAAMNNGAKPMQRATETEYRVIRSWPGVRNGQVVSLHPDRAKRLLKGGFVEVGNA